MHAYSVINSGFAHIDKLGHDQHHIHQEYVITLMLAGYVTFSAQQKVMIKPGMLTLVPAYTAHSLMEGRNIQVHWLSFSAEAIQVDESHELMQPFARIRKGALPICVLPAARLNYVVALFEEIQMELSQARSPKVLESLVCLILNEARNGSELQKPDLVAESKISKALQYIQLHACEGISLKDVAGALYMSPAYLAAKMKQTTGYSVGQWITRHKLTRAKDLLHSTDEKIEQIALKAGWQDITHFIRQFKKAHGQTPAAWRREHKQ